MRKPQGNFFYCDPDPASWQPAVVERDTVTCAHCGRCYRVKPQPMGASRRGRPGIRFDPRLDGEDEAPKCGKCDEHICKECKRRGGCWPLDMALTIIEAPRARLAAAIRADNDRAMFLRDVFGYK